jgi:FkbM family methyltransferase
LRKRAAAGSRVLKDTANQLLSRTIGYRLEKQKAHSLSGPLAFQDLLRFHLSWTPAAARGAVVQVGANDGLATDPLYLLIAEYELTGVLIEPQALPFERLCARYRCRAGLTLLNVGIAESPGEMQLWQVREDFRAEYDWRAGSGASGIASFDRQHVVRHILKNARGVVRTAADAEAKVECVTVPVTTLDAVIAEHVGGTVEILQIDAEGYDYRILRSLDLRRHRPRIVNYESKHLSSADKQACESMLHAHGYVTFGHGTDTCALLLRHS